MRRPCLDTPEHLWISDSPAARHGGNQHGSAKFPWTPALADRAYAMHEAGDSWREVALALAETTGIRPSEFAVKDYVARHIEGGA